MKKILSQTMGQFYILTGVEIPKRYNPFLADSGVNPKARLTIRLLASRRLEHRSFHKLYYNNVVYNQSLFPPHDFEDRK